MNEVKFHVFFGLTIAKKRQAMNLSQAKLAEKAGISTRHCSDVENGKTNVHIDTMLDLVNVLGLSVDAIIADYKNNKDI